jgi:glutathione S-transferase
LFLISRKIFFSRKRLAAVKVPPAKTEGVSHMPHYTALVTVLAVLFYFYTGARVPGARRKFGVPAPAIAGNPDFERVFRVQMNTLEWMPIFLPALWLCALYDGDRFAAALGLIWIGARIFYMTSYTQAADRRGPGFVLQAVVCGGLLIGAVVGIFDSMALGG